MSIAFRRILFPTDFSEVSLAALPYAINHAESFEAELHCIHVLDDGYQYWSALGPESIPAGPPPEEMHALAVTRMGQLREEHLGSLTQSVVTEVIPGRPFKEIIVYAREHQIDLIVMATHGRGAVAHMLLGSTTELVIRKAPCAVLTIRWKDHTFEMP
ncbi:MAG: universal stress protein [Phycisphaerae bacterium]